MSEPNYAIIYTQAREIVSVEGPFNHEEASAILKNTEYRENCYKSLVPLERNPICV